MILNHSLYRAIDVIVGLEYDKYVDNTLFINCTNA